MAASGSAPRACRIEDGEHLRVVTLNRPEVLNALDSDASDELQEVWDEFQDRDDLWVAILTGGTGRAFCAGNDLKSQAIGQRRDPPEGGFGGLVRRSGLSKPIIAAVNGLALGGGFELALACDVIVADENASFALPEVRVGLVASGGGIHRLMRQIPQKKAMGMILTGQRVTAQEAHALGFVNEVTPQGAALEVALRWARDMLAASPMAIRASKEMAYRGFDEDDLATAIRTLYPAQRQNLESEDYREGPLAFAQKRKPSWKNR